MGIVFPLFAEVSNDAIIEQPVRAVSCIFPNKTDCNVGVHSQKHNLTLACFIFLAASTPFNRGIEMSATITSGLNLSQWW